MIVGMVEQVYNSFLERNAVDNNSNTNIHSNKFHKTMKTVFFITS